MAEWLAKPKATKEDLTPYFRNLKTLADTLVEDRLPRIILTLNQELSQKFFQAVKKKYGNITPSNVEKAAMEAIKKWTEST